MENKSLKSDFQVVYKGFDGLDVSFEGCVSQEFIDQLAVAQAEAREQKEDKTIFVGCYGKHPVQVSEGGMRGGYKYRFDTGEDGETWAVKDSQKVENGWNIRVSVKSAAMAAHGYEGVKKRLYEWLRLFGATVKSESVARVDYAIDFLAPDFVLKPDNFVQPGQASCEVHEQCYQMQGNRVTGKTIGRMPGRQVIIYDKRLEVTKKNKDYWWQIWNLPRGSKVWRVELRAGKKHLKEDWGITTFAELEEKVGAMFDEGCTDTNVTRKRLHGFWQEAQGIIKEVFAACSRPFGAWRIVYAVKKRKQQEYKDQLKGIAAAVAKMHDIPHHKIATRALPLLMRELSSHFSDHQDKVKETYRRLQERYVFFDAVTGEIQPA